RTLHRPAPADAEAARRGRAQRPHRPPQHQRGRELRRRVLAPRALRDPKTETRGRPVRSNVGMTVLSRRTAVFALGVIFTANFLSYLDRTLVSALEEPITGAFNLSAEGHGWLWALFTFGYMVFAMPISMLADRRNPPRILALCVVIWSFATI